jgi:hypothetical protein
MDKQGVLGQVARRRDHLAAHLTDGSHDSGRRAFVGLGGAVNNLDLAMNAGGHSARRRLYSPFTTAPSDCTLLLSSP